MKYKVGDKVRIKSLDWYNQNKDKDGFVRCGDKVFDNYMSVFCGSIVTICGIFPYCGYDVREDMQCRTWTDEMIEGIADEPQEKMVSLDKVCGLLKNIIDDDVLVKCGSVIKCMNVDDFIEYFCKVIEE